MNRLATLAIGTAAILLVPACNRQEEAGGNATAAAAEDNDAPRGRRGEGGWRRADANRDGVVTREEVAAESDARFAARDVNKDGKLDGNELNARMRRAADGEAVTKESFRDRALARFDRFDADGNGRLEGDELRRGRGRSGGREPRD